MAKDMINGGRILLECLSRVGVKDIFGYPGGSVIPIYDEIYKFDKITHYLSRHEQGAAHEADGYARSSGRVGVCLATSGPGATNLVTGIMTAYMDSIPLIAITGQVDSGLLGKDAFQESDIVGITIPITKNNYLVKDIRKLPTVVQEAYHLATTGRKGPVLIDIPKNVQTAEIPLEEFEKIYKKGFNVEGYMPTYKGHPGQIKRALKQIKKAERPVIIAGAGITASGAVKEFGEFVEKTGIPVVTTLLGLGCFPSSHQLNYGMLGMHGTAYANLAVDNADLVIALGIRFDDRITGDTCKFCNKADIIHVDIDPAEIGKNIKPDIPIVGDVKRVLKDFNAGLAKAEELNFAAWVEECNRWREEYPILVPAGEGETLLPQYVLHALNDILKGDAIIATDVGQHQMWSAQYLDIEKPNAFLSSGGAGTMGFGLPAAIGAQVANPDQKVVSISGDGGFQMTFQQLMMLVEYKLPVKVLIINNAYLGMVRQWQELFFDNRYSYVNLQYNPDFVKIGEAYGIKSVQIDSKTKLDAELKDLIVSDEPVLINFIVEKEANVFPMIPAGKGVEEMVGLRGELE